MGKILKSPEWLVSDYLFLRTCVLVSCVCSNKLLQTRGLKTAETYSPTAPGAGSLKSRCHRAVLSLKALVGILFLDSSSFRWLLISLKSLYVVSFLWLCVHSCLLQGHLSLDLGPPGYPGWIYLKILDLIISSKTGFPKKFVFTGPEG